MVAPPAQPPVPAKNNIEAVPDSSNGKEKAKLTRIPNPTPQPRPRRSPTPMNEDQEESGSDSDSDYLPGASSRQGPPADEDKEEDDEVGSEDDNEDDGMEHEDSEDNEVRDDDEDEDADDVDRDEVDNSEANVASRKKRERRPKEAKISTKWTWDRRENDRLVKAWGLEEEIDSNPAALHPVRTDWMYQARLGGEPPLNFRCFSLI